MSPEDLMKQRVIMLRTVRRQALAIVNVKAGDQACLLQQHYLEVFRTQQALAIADMKDSFFFCDSLLEGIDFFPLGLQIC